jgi:simple sugar transport system permease protein
MGNVKIPLLSKLPVLGRSLFGSSPMFYVALLIAFVTWLFFNKTKRGLDFAAVGENPHAAESIGIPVVRVKYLACILCGALAGLGGAFLTTGYLSMLTEGMVAGRGFIALSAVIFGGWKIGGIVAATLLFGFADALQMRLLVAVKVIPSELFAMLPYLFTFFALVMKRDKSAGPKAVGQAYIRESQ